VRNADDFPLFEALFCGAIDELYSCYAAACSSLTSATNTSSTCDHVPRFTNPETLL